MREGNNQRRHANDGLNGTHRTRKHTKQQQGLNTSGNKSGKEKTREDEPKDSEDRGRGQRDTTQVRITSIL